MDFYVVDLGIWSKGETIPNVSFAKGTWYPIEKSGQIAGFVQYMIYDYIWYSKC